MQPVQAAQLLEVWERGYGQRPADRALAALSAAWPDMSQGELAALSIGRRDAMLLTLRESVFGPRLFGLTVCPTCGERLELTLEISDVRTPEVAERQEGICIDVQGYEIKFRLPNSADLSAVLGVQGSARERHNRLLDRCILSARHGGRDIGWNSLPQQVVENVEREMANVDGQAAHQLALECATCTHQWVEPLDIASFLWREIDAWARRLLHDVHALASAYSWSEASILALPPWRRQYYLEMLGG